MFESHLILLVEGSHLRAYSHVAALCRLPYEPQVDRFFNIQSDLVILVVFVASWCFLLMTVALETIHGVFFYLF